MKNSYSELVRNHFESVKYFEGQQIVIDTLAVGSDKITRAIISCTNKKVRAMFIVIGRFDSSKKIKFLEGLKDSTD